MLQPLRAVAAFVAVAVAASAGFAENRGVPAFHGDKFTADVSAAPDVDTYILRLGEGSLLTVSAKQYKSALLPAVTVLAPDGTAVPIALLTKGDGTKSVSVKKVPIDETGVWAVRVTGRTGGATGAYTVQFTVKQPKALKLKAVGIPSNSESVFTVPADDGSLVTLSVTEKLGPPLNSVHLEDPAEGLITVPPETPILKKSKTWKGKKIVMNDGLGDYRMVLTGSPISTTTCNISLQAKPAKRTKLKVLLGPEPVIEDLSPIGGRDGVVVVVTASNASNPGVKVFFGDEEVTPTSLTPNGPNLDISVVAPTNTDSDLGKLVPLFVQNADGQGNATNFQFHGTPGPSTVSPLFAPLGGGNTLTITGNNNANRFVPGGDYEVDVGGQAATVVAVLANTITFEAPNIGTPGAVDIVVTDPYGRDGPTITGLQFVGPPTVDDASPTSVSFEGGRTITVEGTGFRTGARVFVDGEEVTPVTVVNSTTLTFAMPAGAAGSFDLEVTDEYDQTDGALAGYLSRRGPFTDVSSTAVPTPGANKIFFADEMVVGDMDGDDAPEILITTHYDTGYGPFFIFANDGTGVFSDETAGRAPTWSKPGDVGQASAVVLGDLDGGPGAEVVMAVRDPFVAPDPFVYYAAGPLYEVFSVYGPTGDPDDLIFDYQTYASTRVLQNDGAGLFIDWTGSSMPAPTGMPLVGAGERWQAADAALGDLDGDSSADLVLVSTFVFESPVDYSYYHGDLIFGEGTYDIYVRFPGAVTYAPATRVFFNDGNGGLAKGDVMPAVTYFPDDFTALEACGGNAVALGDLDGDGSNDIVVSLSYPTYYNPAGPTTPPYYVTATRVLLNSGDGSAFTVAGSALPAPFGASPAGEGSGEYWQADAIALGDLDGDGDKDMVLGRNAFAYWYDTANVPRLRPAIRIFRNDGDAGFSEDTGEFLPASSYAGNSTNTILGIHSIRIGDLDGDGSMDLLVTGHYSGQYDYNNSGYGPFGFIPAGDRPATRLLLNDGEGQFTDVTDAWFPAAVNGDYFQSDALGLGDLDGDGDFDLVLGYADFPNTQLITVGDNPPLRILSTE